MMDRIALLVLINLLTCCYSFKGISIPPDVNSFALDPVVDLSFNSPATYPIEFSEALINKIRTESRLILNNQNPDIIFNCKVTQFTVSSQAPQPGVESAINRLNVSIEVEYKNKKDEKQDWKSTFSRFQDFERDQNFSDVQQKLVAEINQLLINDIFIKAFTNW